MNMDVPIEQSATHTLIKGVVDRVVFHNKETGFCVLQVRAQGHPDVVNMVGMASMITAGESLEAAGQWIKNKTYGLQFKAERLQVIPPSTREGIEKYLASGAVRGIGQHYAKILIDKFGESVFDVLDNTPERLQEVAGIGKKKKKLILSSWAEQKTVRNIMVFLQSHGIGAARAVKIYQTYGESAIDKIRANPYCLMQDIVGVGFKTADELAEKLAIPKDSPLRAGAGLHYILQELSAEGNCAALQSTLQEQAQALLEIPVTVVAAAIEEEITAGRLIREETNDGPVIFLQALYQAELAVAHHIKRLQTAALPWDQIDSDKAIPWVEEQTGVILSASQRLAIQAALQAKVFIITGGPGVGKTTVVKSLLTILKAKRLKVALCAPTGRAAKRLTETTQVEAKTIHRLLEFDPYARIFQQNAENSLQVDLVIVDEVSMLDIELMSHLLQAIPDHAALVLLGDVDQLPSVGPGAVLSDLIASQQIKTVFLKEIFRQAQESHIILNAHRINQGEMPLSTEKNASTDFYFINVETPEAICQTVLQLVTERIPQRFGFHPVNEIQVLSPMNRGVVGSKVLNNLLQERINGQAGPKLQRLDWSFAPGDKVMQLVNNYEKDVFNGDIGRVSSVDSKKALVTVNFEGRKIEYAASELDEIALAYAMSIHKSQGSEYKAVVIVLASQHYRMLVRNLLYTAVTRGKQLVVIVGQAHALATAVRTVQAGTRLTRLASRINLV